MSRPGTARHSRTPSSVSHVTRRPARALAVSQFSRDDLAARVLGVLERAAGTAG
jgi:hypothetical protein